MPLISICIPSFNESKYIVDTLVGLSYQTLFKECEIVIADYDPEGTKATYNTVAMGLRTNPAFAGKIKWIDVFKSGIGIARHIACSQANGKIILNFDADCRFEHTNAIELILGELIRGKYKLCHCWNEINPEEKTAFQKAGTGDVMYQIRNTLHSAGLPFIYEPGSMLSKQTYEELGGFRDVIMLEGPILGFDATLKYGLGAIKFINNVKVLVSGRRFVGSDGVLDLNYHHAFR